LFWRVRHLYPDFRRFLFSGNMNFRIWHQIGKSNLRVSISLSLAVHLIFILSASLLFSGVQVHQPALPCVRVTLVPTEDEGKTISKTTSPPSVKRPEKRESIREEKRVEPIEVKRKDEIKLPVPLPVQTVDREISAEELRPVSPPPKEDKRPEEPPTLTRVATIGTDLIPKREVSSPLPLPSSLPGPVQGDKPSGTASIEGIGKEEGGSREENPRNGSGMERGGFSWKGLGDGAGGKLGGSPGGGFGNGTGAGTGSGSGSGAGPGQGDVNGGGSRKGTEILGKLFPPSGGTGGNHPRYAENPKPSYPREAREKGYQGEVLLRVEVLSNGRVGEIEVTRSSGHEILDRSALSTVKQWKFIPARKGEEPIPLWVNIPIKFQLQ
jgi:TonB family protein